MSWERGDRQGTSWGWKVMDKEHNEVGIEGRGHYEVGIVGRKHSKW